MVVEDGLEGALRKTQTAKHLRLLAMSVNIIGSTQ